MLDFLRPYLARIIAAAVAALIGWVVTKLGIDATSVDQTALATSVGTFLTLVVYSVAHKLFDKSINPADSASTHLAVQGKQDAANLKLVSNSSDSKRSGL